MYPYTHILACIDFSDLSDAVLQRACDQARSQSASLTVLHVLEYYPTDVPVGYTVPAENANPVEVYESRARGRLGELVDGIDCKEATVAVVTTTSGAYHEIVQFAKDNGVDLIVMGYAGRWVTDALGSTAMAAARHVVCDVLMVRKRAAAL